MRTSDTMTLAQLIDATADDGDLLAECLASLGYEECDDSGSVAHRWQISRDDMRRTVRLTRDSLGRIDSISTPQF